MADRSAENIRTGGTQTGAGVALGRSDAGLVEFRTPGRVDGSDGGLADLHGPLEFSAGASQDA
jgi:hypothetical protein